MTSPKRHHWWPEVQSREWAGADGCLHVVRSDGSTFKAPPSKVGVEGELYTKIDSDGRKNREIELWFSKNIETPFSNVLPKITGLSGIERRRYPGPGNLKHREEVKELGFINSDWDERIPLSASERQSLVDYLAALVVRSPRYLAKLVDWHSRPLASEQDDKPLSAGSIRNTALANMLYLFEIYREAIGNAYISLTISECDKEFLFADIGVAVKEPWTKDPLPFDLYAPLTPKLALNVMPLPIAYTGGLWLARVNSRGVTRFNRMIVGAADRFVFSRSDPPLQFIRKHFGQPAPAPFGTRWVDGGWESTYDRSRDRPF